MPRRIRATPETINGENVWPRYERNGESTRAGARARARGGRSNGGNETHRRKERGSAEKSRGRVSAAAAKINADDLISRERFCAREFVDRALFLKEFSLARAAR